MISTITVSNKDYSIKEEKTDDGISFSTEINGKLYNLNVSITEDMIQSLSLVVPDPIAEIRSVIEQEIRNEIFYKVNDTSFDEMLEKLTSSPESVNSNPILKEWTSLYEKSK